MAENRGNLYNDDFKPVAADVNKCQCKDCEFRKRDVLIDGDLIRGATNTICEVYPQGEKPIGIIWYEEKCPYYVKE